MNKSPEKEPSEHTNSVEPFEVEIDRQIGDLVPQKARGEVVRRVSATLHAEFFSGPIAHPRHLAKYEEIHPGAADRIIAMAEKRNEHHMQMEQEFLKAERHDRSLGMYLGAVCFAALILGAAVTAVITTSPVIPGLFLGTAAIGAISAFIKGR